MAVWRGRFLASLPPPAERIPSPKALCGGLANPYSLEMASRSDVAKAAQEFDTMAHEEHESQCVVEISEDDVGNEAGENKQGAAPHMGQFAQAPQQGEEQCAGAESGSPDCGAHLPPTSLAAFSAGVSATEIREKFGGRQSRQPQEDRVAATKAAEGHDAVVDGTQLRALLGQRQQMLEDSESEEDATESG